MFDLESDPDEMVNVFGDSKYAEAQAELMTEYHRLRKHFEAPEYDFK